jgi:hypothetical protein
MNMEAVIKDLQDTLTILDEAEGHQSKVLPEHGERLVIEQQISECCRESAKYQMRTAQNLAEITDKLNRLLGYPTP